MAQARAEERRAMAVATEQEMRAENTKICKLKVVEAQAEVLKHWQKLSETVILVLWITTI